MTTLRRVLLLSALVLLAAAASAWVSGGWAIDVAGIVLRVRRPDRTAAEGAALLAAWAAWARGRWREDIFALARAPWSTPGALPAGAVAAVCLAGISFGAFVAGSADSYGYISEAAFLLEGRIRVPQELTDAPWPEPSWTLSPLGYRPATVPDAIVPTYPPGLPLLFAGARAAAGPCAPYLVVPFAGALLVWLTYRLGARLLPPPLAAGASLVLAASPTFLFQVMWPMSDVPVAALWIAAALLAVGAEGRAASRAGPPSGSALATGLPQGGQDGSRDLKEPPARPLAAGLVTSLAILVRPNLAPLAVVCLGAILIGRTKEPGVTGTLAGVVRRQRALAFLAGLAPGVVALGVFNTYAYGAWWRLGYSGVDQLYSLANILPNLRRYVGWTIHFDTPAILLGFLPLAAGPRFFPSLGGWRFLLTGLVAGVWLSYLPYLQFDDWWYLRFLLPAWPVLAVLAVAAIQSIVGRVMPGAKAGGAALAIVLVLAGVNFGRAINLDVFGLRPGEQRYVDAADYVARRTPPGSVVLSMQHSGSVRYYGSRTTLRYDLLEPEWLDRAIAFLEQRGRRVYILLEDWEVPLFRARFAGTLAGDLGWIPAAEWRTGKVLLFDAGNRTSGQSPERMLPAKGVGCATPTRTP